MTQHAWMTLGGVAVFALVWAGLLTNIIKIARRGRHPPRFHPLLAAAHLGRFAGWALVGATTLRQDPLTGWLLLITRVPAVGLIVVTFLQRIDCRPPRALLSRWVMASVGGLVLFCIGAALVESHLPRLEPRQGANLLPPASLLQYGLNALVVVCFAIQLLYGLPLQIKQAIRRPLGNLRWFQLALLANYAYAFVYASFVVEPLTRMVMRGAYGVALLEQAMLVVLIERGVRRLRRGDPGPTTSAGDRARMN